MKPLTAGLGAQDEADGGLFARLAFVFVQPFQIQLHLAFVRGFEAAQFQLDGYQAAQAAVVITG